MCGRYNITTDAQALIDAFDVIRVNIDLNTWRPRYNIAPSQDVPIVRQNEAERELITVRWGLVPFWAKDAKIGYKMINARAETVSEKPAFRAAFKRRRCLIPASGFYEWRQEKGHKQPYNIRFTSTPIFAFAGLWEHWKSPKGEIIESCAIIVTDANDLIRPIHDRMPVVLDPEDYDPWLDPNADPSSGLTPLLQPHDPAPMRVEPVSKRVNNPRFDDPDCLVSPHPV